MYELTYLPIALNDLSGIIFHITDKLKAPEAAADLLDAFDRSILLLKDFPYAHPLYRPIRPLTEEYRLLPVRNFDIFYVVKEQERLVEIHRVIYAKMDLNRLLI